VIWPSTRLQELETPKKLPTLLENMIQKQYGTKYSTVQSHVRV